MTGENLLQTDVLIIGSGIAGSSTALTLADSGVPVTVVTRARRPENSNTLWAQGGIIFKGEQDSPEKLAEDIKRAGAGLCNPKAVRILAEEGPDAVQEMLLDRVDVQFDRSDEGNLSLALEGGHSVSRIIHSADSTGKAIEIALIRAVEAHPDITLLTAHTAIDLITPSHHSTDPLAIYKRRHCVGAYLLDQQTGEVVRALARMTVVATGGLGQIFLRTTNPGGARGDGIAMAYRAGARVINAEFVQFHPTAFYRQGSARFLVSEAVRGAGARLVNADGIPFMQKYEPEWLDLAPRDVVARSIHHEMLEGDVANVFLDLHSYIERDEILSHFPTIYKRALDYGVDITRDLVPVVPAAHYSCGGIWTDERGRTTIQNLYAVGEVSCTGLHGANRLASTSLLEGLVWGRRAARHVQSELKPAHVPNTPKNAHGTDSELYSADLIPEWAYAGEEVADPALISQDMSTVKHIMWNYVGLVRTTARLDRALRDLHALESEIEAFYRSRRLTDDLIGLRNAVRTAIIVANAAWQNKRSVGCHYRE